MKPKMIWANYAVSDLGRTSKFYKDLGFKPNGEHSSKELVSFFFGDDKFVIHFFLKDVLQANTKMNIIDARQSNEIIFTLSAGNKTEVDHWATEVEKAGGNIHTPPTEFGKGYYGFDFSDPDGHRFNIFWMEGL